MTTTPPSKSGQPTPSVVHPEPTAPHWWELRSKHYPHRAYLPGKSDPASYSFLEFISCATVNQSGRLYAFRVYADLAKFLSDHPKAHTVP